MISDKVVCQLDVSDAKAAIIEMLNTINEDVKLKQIKESCSDDMVKYIQSFLPLVIEIQHKIIIKYGFTADNKGLMEFTNKIKELALQDDNVANLFENFRNLLVPPLNLRTQFV